MSKWIKCSDELPPEDNCWVLVYADGAVNCMAYYQGQWRDWVEATCHNVNTDQITHWMPLPEPPTND